jgi:hypothetical protein
MLIITHFKIKRMLENSGEPCQPRPRVPYNEKCLQYLRSRQGGGGHNSCHSNSNSSKKQLKENSLEQLDRAEASSTSEETDSDKESGVTQIEVRTTTTTTTRTTTTFGNGTVSSNKLAMRRGVSAEPERKQEGGVAEATYLRMDGKIREAMTEAGGEGDNGSDITVEEDKEGRRGGERPEEIDASTER